MNNRSVTVLAPNGRRQIVKCNLNTTILQILEEVCKKQGFEASEYDIKHHNKALDTSLTVQFSGLPNNAQLELGPVSKARKESEITVALNFENGTRVLGTFLPSNTLQDVLNSLCETHEPNPVVIYMRRELYGEDLSKTDLKSLGLTGGRAMFRLIHKLPEELKTQANVSSVIPSKPVEEKPYKRVFQPLESNNDEIVKKSAPENGSDSVESNNNSDKIVPTSKNVSAHPDILKLAKERQKGEQEENSKDSEEVPNKVSKGRTIIKEGRALNSEKPANVVENVKAGDQQRQTVNLSDFPFIGDKKGLLFSMESCGTVQYSEDPPDDFYNLTIEDAKTILRDIRKSREEAEEGGPLMTAALRELEESKKQLRQLAKYNKCIIRVLFPDRTVLQAVFSPIDLVKTVLDFVGEQLSNKNLPFHLYTTPPKFVLPEDKRLIEVNCVPGALLHFGMEDKYKLNDNFIREDLKDKFTTNSMASLAALKIREESKKKKEQEEVENQSQSNNDAVAGCSKEFNSSNGANQIKRNSNTADNNQLPKWFKGT